MPTAKLIQPRAPRFYTPEGEALYEVPNKSKPGTTRPFTLADARKMDPHPLPSVTTILSETIRKPQLEDWKVEQGIMAALTLPRLPNESTDAFAHRVVQDMSKEAEGAADFGRTIHQAIEAHLIGDVNTLQSLPETVMPFLDEFIKWQESVLLTVQATELVVTNKEIGYAGRLDIWGDLNWKGAGNSVLDIKTQHIKNGKPTFYDEWAMQLAAYAWTFEGTQKPSLVSIVIDSQEPKAPIIKVWENSLQHFQAFLDTLSLWRYFHEYP